MAIGLAQAIALRAPGQKAKAPAPKKPVFDPRKVLEGIGSTELLSPQQEDTAARALTSLEVRPQVKGYARNAKLFGQEKQREAKGLEGLGKRNAGEVSSVYQNIAKSAAQSLATENALSGALSGQSAQIASQGAQQLGAESKAAVEPLTSQLQIRGAEGTAGTAQAQLAQAVAAQSAAQASQGTAAQQAAASQGAGYTGLLGAESLATQERGGEAIGSIARGAANRVGESNAKFNTNIQLERGKASEAKAASGEDFVKNLLGIRGEQQKYETAEQAVAGEKAKLGLSAEELGVEKEQNAIANKIAQQKANASTTSANASSLSAAASARNAATDAWKARHPEATRKEAKKAEEYIGEVKSYLPSAVATYGAPKNKKELNQFIGAVNKEVSASPQIVRSVLERWFAKRSLTEGAANAAAKVASP